MAKVYRKFEGGYHIDPWGDRIYGETKSVTWKNLTKKEKTRVGLSRLALTSVLAGLVVISLPNGPVDSWGDSPKAADRDDQVDEAFERADRLYKAQTLEGKYSLLYINPAHTTVTGEVDGSGFLGWIGSGGPALNVNVGQNCFAGRAYDITPSELRIRGFSNGGGDVSAPAALAPTEDGGVEIYPAGSNAPALHFDISEDGMLVADTHTAATIESYGCEVGLGVYEETSHNHFTKLQK